MPPPAAGTRALYGGQREETLRLDIAHFELRFTGEPTHARRQRLAFPRPAKKWISPSSAPFLRVTKRKTSSSSSSSTVDS